MNTAARRTVLVWVLCALTAASLTALPRIPAQAGPESAHPAAGMPGGVPDAAREPEPSLPAPPPSVWPFGDAFPRTSGTDRLAGGAFFWTDFLYDDTGSGTYAYPFSDTNENGQNGADIFTAAVGLRGDSSYWRVDWNTLISPDIPIAEWAFDTDDDPATGAAELPAGANATAPGIDLALAVSSRGAWLIDPVTGRRIDIRTVGGSISVDTASRSFVVRVPTSVVRPTGQWRIRLVAGLADQTGQWFAPAWNRAGTADPVIDQDGTRVYNEAFRSTTDEPVSATNWSTPMSSSVWNNAAQSAALRARDAAAFSTRLNWALLRARVATAEARPTGLSVRWYVSSLDLGQGLLAGTRVGTGPALSGPQFFGRVQPYTVYVPADYRPSRPAPLTILLHAGDRNQNGFAGPTEGRVYGPMCAARDAICVTPLGRGNSTWYINEAEVDVWQVWHDLALHYSLDPDRTIVGGWSMGGVGATRLVVNHPDLFAAGFVAAGAGYYDSLGRRDQGDDPLRAENLRELPVMWLSGMSDVALLATLNWESFLHSSGVQYRVQVTTSTPNGHGDIGTGVGWDELLPYFAQFPATRDSNPGRVVFRWSPGDGRADLGTAITSAYWLSGLQPRDATLRWSRLDVSSGAAPEPDHTLTYSDVTQTLLSTTDRVMTQSWTPTGPAPPPTQSLTVNLTNVAHIGADIGRTGIHAAAPFTVDVTSDGASVIELDNVVQGSSASIGGTTAAVARHTTLRLAVPPGTTTVTILPPRRR